MANSSSVDLQDKKKFDHKEVVVNHAENEEVNIEIIEKSARLVINKVPDKSAFKGKLREGDYILNINGKTVKTQEEFIRTAVSSHPEIRLKIARPKSKLNGGSQKGVSEKSEKSIKLDRAKRRAEENEFEINENNEYLLIRVKMVKSGKNLGLGIIKLPDRGFVICKTVKPNSVSAELFKPGDRFLMIDKVKVKDTTECRSCIAESKGDFEALIERPPNGMEAYRNKTPSTMFKNSTYSPPVKTNPDHQQGNPLDGYKTPPKDVDTILTKKFEDLVKTFGNTTKTDSKWTASKIQNQVNIETNVEEQSIESDIAPGSQLKKPSKTTQ